MKDLKKNQVIVQEEAETVGSFGNRCCICGGYFEDGVCDNGHQQNETVIH